MVPFKCVLLYYYLNEFVEPLIDILHVKIFIFNILAHVLGYLPH